MDEYVMLLLQWEAKKKVRDDMQEQMDGIMRRLVAMAKRDNEDKRQLKIFTDGR